MLEHTPAPARPAVVPLRVQLGRFVATGVLSACVDLGLLLLLTSTGLPYGPAKSLSFIAGTTTAYLINRRWTFVAEHNRARFLGVIVLYAATFALQVGTATLLFHPLLGAGLGRVPATVASFVIGQGLATTVNFVVQRAVIFRSR